MQLLTIDAHQSLELFAVDTLVVAFLDAVWEHQNWSTLAIEDFVLGLKHLIECYYQADLTLADYDAHAYQIYQRVDWRSSWGEWELILPGKLPEAHP
jgi:hypothetical protein